MILVSFCARIPSKLSWFLLRHILTITFYLYLLFFLRSIIQHSVTWKCFTSTPFLLRHLYLRNRFPRKQHDTLAFFMISLGIYFCNLIHSYFIFVYGSWVRHIFTITQLIRTPIKGTSHKLL